MGLLDREAKDRKQVGDVGKPNRNPKNTTKEYTASDRKTVKVDPPVKNRIEILKSILDKKEYQLIDEMVDFYINNHLDEREQRIVKGMENARRE